MKLTKIAKMMSKSIIEIRRKRDGKILRDEINDACQTHNIYDGDVLVESNKDYNIGYSEWSGFYDFSEYEELADYEEQPMMTQEEKDLLLKDLCARARYKVKICVPKGMRININGKIKEQDLVDTVYGVIFYNEGPKIVTPQNFSFLDKNGIYNFGGWSVEMVKPYLRPMSTMSSKERRELRQWGSLCMTEKDVVEDVGVYGAIHSIPTIDWLNAHHFDYRGLIEKGLALEAPEGMYK